MSVEISFSKPMEINFNPSADRLYKQVGFTINNVNYEIVVFIAGGYETYFTNQHIKRYLCDIINKKGIEYIKNSKELDFTPSKEVEGKCIPEPIISNSIKDISEEDLKNDNYQIVSANEII